MPNSLIIDSNKALICDESLIGIKAKRLAKLSVYQPSVPTWYVLSTEAYDLFLQENKLTTPLHNILNKVISESDYSSVSNEIKSLFAGCHLPDRVQSILIRLINPTAYFAIRNSSSNDYLYQKGFENIEKAILDSYRNVFTKELLKKIIKSKESILLPKSTIIIQQMIDPNVAGVAYSLNINNGNPKECLIHANYGVWKGSTDSDIIFDEYTIQHFTNLISENIQQKDYMYVANLNGSIKQKIPCNNRARACLNNDQIKQIKDLTLKIALKENRPQIIKWAIDRYGTIRVLGNQQLETVKHSLPLEEINQQTKTKNFLSHKKIKKYLQESFISSHQNIFPDNLFLDIYVKAKINNSFKQFNQIFNSEYDYYKINYLQFHTIPELLELGDRLRNRLIIPSQKHIQINDYLYQKLKKQISKKLKLCQLNISEKELKLFFSFDQDLIAPKSTQTFIKLAARVNQTESLKDLFNQYKDNQLHHILPKFHYDFFTQCESQMRLIGETNYEWFYGRIRHYAKLNSLTFDRFLEEREKYEKIFEISIYQTIESNFGKKQMKRFKKDFKLFRRVYQQREHFIHKQKLIHNLAKAIYLQIGQLLRTNRLIEDANQVFDLTYKELINIHKKNNLKDIQNVSNSKDI